MTFALLAPLQRQLKAVSSDLRTQSEERPELRDWLHGEYETAFGTRTGGTYETWRDEQVDQAAVAWVLGTVFVRFCEDNELIDQPWIAGPGNRTDAAVDAKTSWLLTQTELRHSRHWLRHVFSHLAKLPATAALFDKHNPVWRWDLSADAAAALLEFWQVGAGVHDFAAGGLDTRFLGDLYQDLSVEARKRYALLQTPEFVEEFILDLTLEESLNQYGLEDTSLIDPTCGSGHFLLGAFDRLMTRWEREHAATGVRERVQKTLDQLTGVDINPFAIAIARFRLIVAALQACDEKSLMDAPGFQMRLATGDSLLKWGREDSSHQGDMLALLKTGEAYTYYTEDAEALADYLKPGQYSVAVGNPPYIAVKDKILNEKYRQLYKETCSGKYAVSVPFAQLFFELVRTGDRTGRAGIVGQITANSFMKREFGRKIINEYFNKQVDLSYIIDTAGAYIPGHATPTAILVGYRRQPRPVKIRAVLGVLGEPSVPEDPSQGRVWLAIRRSVLGDDTGAPYVSSVELPRDYFASHPWSLGGGGAGDLMQQIESGNTTPLGQFVAKIGVFGMTNADEVMITPRSTVTRLSLDPDIFARLVLGDEIRDYRVLDGDSVFFPYTVGFVLRELDVQSAVGRRLWPFMNTLGNRATFNKLTYFQEARPWYEWHQVTAENAVGELTIAWPELATHNHFVFSRGGKVFNRSAPVIKLPESHGEREYLGLLGLLNSSTVCFWLKQSCFDKGNGGIGGGISDEHWEHRFVYNASRLQALPLAMYHPVRRSMQLDDLAQTVEASMPATVLSGGIVSRAALSSALDIYESSRRAMIALQEELDWEAYGLYGLLEEQDVLSDALPPLNLGERAFEIVLARRIANEGAVTEWFARHGSTPITEIPTHWPTAYQEVVARRIDIIESRPDIALIERPECKRRWASVPWEVQEQAALRDWLLDRLEAETMWRGPDAGRPMSVAVLADEVGADADFRSVFDLYCGRDDYDVAHELTRLVADEAVPFLAAYRYKPSGLDKRAQWERTWDLQRREDAGETLDKPIPVPPKYVQADFAKAPYWRNRGKLDVPKERFIVYPYAGREGDRSPVIGWAGWDHLEQAQVLASLYIDRKQNEGWPRKQLLPLLAGLVELEPWLHQWHGEPAPGYPGSPAELFTTLIDAELAEHGADRAEVGLGMLP